MTAYVTTDEITDRLSVTPRYVRRLAREGRLPARQLSPRGRLLFEAGVLEQVLHPTTSWARAPSSTRPR
jgi:excisionase family DNA binding protein